LEDAQAKIQKLSTKTEKTVAAPSDTKVSEVPTTEPTTQKAPLEETGVEAVTPKPAVENVEAEVEKVSTPALEEKVKIIKDTFSEAVQQ